MLVLVSFFVVVMMIMIVIVIVIMLGTARLFGRRRGVTFVIGATGSSSFGGQHRRGRTVVVLGHLAQEFLLFAAVRRHDLVFVL